MRSRIFCSITGLKGLFIALFVLALGFSPPPALAQFNSGSTGANGAFPPIAPPAGTTEIVLDLRNGNVTFLPSGTVATLPNTPLGGFADGVLNFTTVNVASGVTLSLVRNEANSPVTILAQSAVNVLGTIDVSGEKGEDQAISGGGAAGPGGFKGGHGEIVRSSTGGAGDGLGPGGGKGGGRLIVDSGGGGGGFGTTGGNDRAGRAVGGSTYGTVALLPLLGGSGGGGGCSSGEAGPSGGGGGGGGGAILIASSTTIDISGSILAKGGAGGTQAGGGGSGGAIRLIAETLSGAGTLSAAGGGGGSEIGGCFQGGAGGSGRIRREASFNNFTGTITGVVSNAGPGVVLLPNAPTVRIVSVNGKAVPANPTGVFGGVDVVLDAPGTVPVELAATRVPLGTTIEVTAKSEVDAGVIGPVTSLGLAGTFENSTATVDLTFPTGGVFFVEARATFTAPAP